MLLGPKSGVAVAVLRTLAELTLFPGPAGVFGPLIALAGTLSMLLGIYLCGRLLKRKASQDKNLGIKSGTYFTVFGALPRTAIMPFVMYAVYRFLYPLTRGISFTDAQIMVLMPPLIVFIFTLCLYTISIGYLIARKVGKNLKIDNQL